MGHEQIHLQRIKNFSAVEDLNDINRNFLRKLEHDLEEEIQASRLSFGLVSDNYRSVSSANTAHHFLRDSSLRSSKLEESLFNPIKKELNEKNKENKINRGRESFEKKKKKKIKGGKKSLEKKKKKKKKK